ncbi:MAG: ABC transporter substrate-binding protein [Betaproteobacteria bacterium]|nr:ABC transporter substrate-binding protein [Betaproteobacteria bacterium]
MAVVLGAISAPVEAEVKEVRLAQQFGVNYLPLIIMKRHGLIEKHAQAAGLGAIKATWAQFGSGAAMNDALLSDNLDFASGGVGPLLKIWDRSKGEFDVKGVASLGSMPLYLTTINPNVASIRDFTRKDRIALPAVRSSIQAIVLQMAAAKAFGEANFAQLDDITVSMKHPDAMAAMLNRAGEISAHFANSPFQEQELQSAGVRKVLSSYEVLGGPSTLNSLYTTAKFRNANSGTYRAVLAALKGAIEIINRDKRAAAQVYLEEERSKLTADFVHKTLADPEFVVTTTPQGIMKYADFMHRVKGIRNRPASWKDVYFPEIHGEGGN